jgi:outer membrane protein OmpA-like peptidoglycan-associated protein
MRIGVAAMTAVLVAALSSCAASPKQIQGGAGAPPPPPPGTAAETEKAGPLPDEMIASYMDGEESAIRAQFNGAYGEELRRRQDTLMLTFEADSLFAPNSGSLGPEPAERLGRLAEILRRYPRTLVIVEAHTDNTPRAGEGQLLSEQRARAVAEVLRARGVASSRIQILGYGSTRPLAPNAIEAGRRKNRRITIDIAPMRKG